MTAVVMSVVRMQQLITRQMATAVRLALKLTDREVFCKGKFP